MGPPLALPVLVVLISRHGLDALRCWGWLITICVTIEMQTPRPRPRNRRKIKIFVQGSTCGGPGAGLKRCQGLVT